MKKTIDDVKELELTTRLKNNRLRRLRIEAGVRLKDVPEKMGVSVSEYCELESLRASPKTRDGKWRKAATKLADFFLVDPEDLFTPVTQAVKNPVVRREVSAEEAMAILSDYSRGAIDSGTPSDAFDQLELAEQVDQVLSHLTPAEEDIIRSRFGIGRDTDMTHAEIAEIRGVSRTRPQQIESRALRRLRHPALSSKLKPWVES